MSFLTDQVLSDVEDVIVSLLSDISAAQFVDVGCWDGRATMRYADACNATNISGIEIFPAQIVLAQQKGIHVHKVDLEDGKLPIGDASVDLVVCNQVFEHLKGVFDLLSEIHRVLVPGGRFIFSVPNLASFHNRIMLLCGMQPSSIRIIGPHVRGFTFGHTVKFLELNKLFKVTRTRGCGFYPFPIVIGRLIGRLWKAASHTFVIDMVKQEADAPNWTETVKEAGFQTVFFDEK